MPLKACSKCESDKARVAVHAWELTIRRTRMFVLYYGIKWTIESDW